MPTVLFLKSANLIKQFETAHRLFIIGQLIHEKTYPKTIYMTGLYVYFLWSDICYIGY